ncbi:MAG: DegT/DnrJ/EryC1/StrS aminotransferase family protein [Pseudomonadota bacterium]
MPFIDLQAQRAAIGPAIEEAILKVVRHGAYILGPEVSQLEKNLAEFCGAEEVVSCANGTDALTMVLLARGVKPGDAVFCPSFTFAATAEVIALIGATPVFIDVSPETFNMDANSLKAGIKTARDRGLKPVGLITVDLFGQPADYDALLPVADDNKLWVMCDAAQAFGADYKGRKLGTIGDVTTTSFFPAKPLGCYGDGGAIFTDDGELAETLRSIRVHGQGTDKYDNVRLGLTGRLDTIQAAVLIEKLKIFPAEIIARQQVAERYQEGLKDVAVVPHLPDEMISVWAQYTLRFPKGNRDAVSAKLKTQGIPTAIYYPKPMHRQQPYEHFPMAGNGLPVTDQLASEVLSLPMHAYLKQDVQDKIIEAVREAA